MINKEMQRHKFIGILGLFIFFFWFVYNFNYGELVQYGNGFGWDGQIYARWAQANPIWPATFDVSSLLEFPLQMCFMSTGAWMSHTMYGVF